MTKKKNKKLKVSREVRKTKREESGIKGLQEGDVEFTKRARNEFVLGLIKGAGFYLTTSSIPWEYLMKLCNSLTS